MSFLSKLLKATQSSQTNDRTPSYTSNVTTAPAHSLPGRDTERERNETESSLTETLGEAETSEVAAPSPSPNYIYYRIYADDGAIPSKAPIDPGDPFLGRIKAKYVQPPRNVKAVKRSIEIVENIKHRERPSLFLTPYSESPMDDDYMFTFHNHGTGPGSKPQEPLAFVSKMSDSSTLGEAKISEVATSNYIYYRIYTEDGSLPSKTPVDPGDPFLGRIVAEFVPPPHNAKAVKRSIAKVENIKDRESTTFFLTPYSKSPMDDADKISSQNGTGPGYSAYAPVALVAKMSDSERTTLESDGRGRLASTAKPHPDIRHVYYMLYADGYAMQSKVAFDPEEPFLGRIRADSVAPPHSATTFKLCISRAESNPEIAYAADLFVDTSCETPLKEGYISLRSDGPGLSPDEPMAIVLTLPIPVPDGKYVIKNREEDMFWNAYYNPIVTVFFSPTTMKNAKNLDDYQWDITHDTDGIFMTSPYAPSSWVGANLNGSTVPVPWRLIPADGKSYYLTTETNLDSQNPRVPEVQGRGYGTMATLKKGDQRQMWEFIPV